MNCPIKGLYAITQTNGKSSDKIIKEVTLALEGGIQMLQFRDKSPEIDLHLLESLQALCQNYQVPFLINDHVDLAVKVGADGVHLGKDDSNLALARQTLGRQAIIGISCYNDVDRAIEMAERGASYVAFGRFFPSGSKPLAAPAELETLRLASQSLQIPIVAIGGILPENAPLLLDAGAQLLAVIGGIFDADPKQSTQNFQKILAQYEPR